MDFNDLFAWCLRGNPGAFSELAWVGVGGGAWAADKSFSPSFGLRSPRSSECLHHCHSLSALKLAERGGCWASLPTFLGAWCSLLWWRFSETHLGWCWVVGTVSPGTNAAQRPLGQFAGEREPRGISWVSAFPEQAQPITPETHLTPHRPPTMVIPHCGLYHLMAQWELSAWAFRQGHILSYSLSVLRDWLRL